MLVQIYSRNEEVLVRKLMYILYKTCTWQISIERVLLLKWENIHSIHILIKFSGVANHFLTWLANSANHVL